MSLQSLQTVIPSPAAEGETERFDAIACLDERIRHQAVTDRPTAPGQYLEVQGPARSLTIKLEGKALHIGRGLAAELRLDDSSVSRRHAILVPARGARASSTTAAPTAPSSTGAACSSQSCATAT